MCVAEAWNHRQRHFGAVFEPSLAVGHKSELAEGHAMHDGYGQTSDPRGIFHVEYGAVDGHAVGVGAVEHYHILAVGRGCVHEVDHGAVVGVIAQAYILNINHQDIEFVHHLFCRHALAFALVERGYRQARRTVDAAGYVFAGVGSAAEAVFRREEGGHIHSAAEHEVNRVAVAHHAGVV